MARRQTTMEVSVEYDDRVTDPEALADMMDRILDFAVADPGIDESLDEEYGGVRFGAFFVAKRK